MCIPKAFKSFRFNPQLYMSFKESAAKNGYTVTAALEKFMACAVYLVNIGEYSLILLNTVDW